MVLDRRFEATPCSYGVQESRLAVLFHSISLTTPELGSWVLFERQLIIWISMAVNDVY